MLVCLYPSLFHYLVQSDIPFMQTFYSLQKDHMSVRETGPTKLLRQSHCLLSMSSTIDIPLETKMLRYVERARCESHYSFII